MFASAFRTERKRLSANFSSYTKSQKVCYMYFCNEAGRDMLIKHSITIQKWYYLTEKYINAQANSGITSKF
ncbi:MAG: hypothetical protein SWX82_20015 [Cyanobacteriota bacterium]|nr:hypothetical protein [Cyanobacteriota bacterium]